MAFLIPCTEMRSTDSSWSKRQQQEEEEEDVTRDSEACASTGPLSPPPTDPTPTFQTPSQPAPPVVDPENIRTHRSKRKRSDRQEDRLIACLDALAHPAPKLTSDAHFLLSLETRMLLVPPSRNTEARETLTRALDSFIPHDDFTQPNNAPQHPPPHPPQYPPQHPPQHPPPTHTYTSQTYPQTNIPHPHDTWHTQPQSSYSYASTSMGTNTSTTTQMQPGQQSGGMREPMRDNEPQYQNL
ncbi:RNA-binding protein 33-like [Bufo gargarizans]|uniref:RNA-binding protein 33-like n=1 Tax=Bufo gargarizans TaxID=30331 RepID=UPI001CF1B33A|nr:RNA-binding protein 33-like [Bufo gargarizans]